MFGHKKKEKGLFDMSHDYDVVAYDFTRHFYYGWPAPKFMTISEQEGNEETVYQNSLQSDEEEAA